MLSSPLRLTAGLGLVITKALVEQMGGEVSLTSVEGARDGLWATPSAARAAAESACGRVRPELGMRGLGRESGR